MSTHLGPHISCLVQASAPGPDPQAQGSSAQTQMTSAVSLVCPEVQVCCACVRDAHVFSHKCYLTVINREVW